MKVTQPQLFINSSLKEIETGSLEETKPVSVDQAENMFISAVGHFNTGAYGD